MKLLEFPEEVRSLYLENSHIMNNYIDAWINTTLDLETSKREIHISSNILKSLSDLLDVSLAVHKPGYLKMDFNEQSASVKFTEQSENLIIRSDSKITLDFTFKPTWTPQSRIISKKLFNRIKSDLIQFNLPYYYKVSDQDLDLSKWDSPNIAMSSKDLIKEIATSRKTRQSYKKLSSALDIMALINTSLLELKGSRHLLDTSIEYNMWDYAIVHVTWYFYIIPDLLLYSCLIYPNAYYSNRHTKSYMKEDRVYIPGFILTMAIIPG